MLLTERDVYLFREGTQFGAHRFMGAHAAREGNESGTHFRVWAPNARAVSVAGDFNDWSPAATHVLQARADGSGLWEGFLAEAGRGSRYKYRLDGADGRRYDKSDPYAFHTEVPPATASVVWDLAYDW